MIRTTRLNGSELVVNADLIEFLEKTPETMIHMTSGRKVVVREPVEEIMRRVEEFRMRVKPVLKSAEN